MKRVFVSLLLATTLAGRLAGQGTDAVALAAQRENEENVRRLTATISEVQTALEEQRRQITDLRGEVDKLRGEVAKANNNAATQESLKRLNEQISKVDESRLSDNKRIQEALKDLARLIAERPTPPPAPRLETPPARTPSSSGGSSSKTPSGPIEEGFEYVVRPGDRLDIIVKRYREEEKIMVTQKMVQDANPSVRWEKLKVGQKIFIPKPSK